MNEVSSLHKCGSIDGQQRAPARREACPHAL